IEDAADHGLVLGENGKLYDTKQGQALPDGVSPMPTLTDEELKEYPEMSPMQVIGMGVRRYNDMMALGQHATCTESGEACLI
ncbi:MAG: cupin, partial [Pseudomonadota bacterium]